MSEKTPWTAEVFQEVVGFEPEVDDLVRVNCPYAGRDGHWLCGTCSHGYPKFLKCSKCMLSGDQPSTEEIFAILRSEELAKVFVEKSYKAGDTFTQAREEILRYFGKDIAATVEPYIQEVYKIN